MNEDIPERNTKFTVKWKILIIMHKQVSFLYGLMLPGLRIFGHFPAFAWDSYIEKKADVTQQYNV